MVGMMVFEMAEHSDHDSDNHLVDLWVDDLVDLTVDDLVQHWVDM
jgi:hypothetical protein